MQVDESTDISGKAQLIAFIRFVSDGKVSDRFFCCNEPKERTTGPDTFDILSNYLEENESTWKECVGLYRWSSVYDWVNQRVCVICKNSLK